MLVGLAKSWLQPPTLQSNSARASYDPAQRAYVVTDQRQRFFQAEFLADPDHPAWHPAIIMKDHKLDHPAIVLNGQKLVEGRHFKSGVVLGDQGYKTIIWINEIIKKKTTLTIKGSEESDLLPSRGSSPRG
jgi:hypothetical protein